MPTQEKLRVAIIGGGIGGLVLAVAMEHMDAEKTLEITIYEASSTVAEIGAGINFWPRGWEIMKNVGLERTLLELLPFAPDEQMRVIFQIRKADEPQGSYIKDLKMRGGSIRFHRAQLQQALLGRVSSQVHLSHRLLSYEEAAQDVVLRFQNGKTATCDVLIGMDGIKSTVRKDFLASQGLSKSPSWNPVWSGTVAYRGLVATEALEAELPGHRAVRGPMMYLGKLKHVIAYPVSCDRYVNVVAFHTDPAKEGITYEGPTSINCTQEEVMNAFGGWEEEVRALLRCIKQPTKWIIQALVPMDRYAKGRVILAGDAAHAMTPHQGAGAGQAVEDAYILASLFSQRNKANASVQTISDIFNTIRCPAGNKVLEGSRQSGRLTQLVAPGLDNVKEGDTVAHEKLVEVADALAALWDWVWLESAEGDRQRALEMLNRPMFQAHL
ncbi:salicylate hydroxylase [Panaeolus papilionaceus]|nr:salicylate hydroxylase [Panaeolus papilionaceus]